MSSKIQIYCPHCHSTLEAEEDWIGMETTCPSCNQEFEISSSKKVPSVIPAAPGNDKLSLMKAKRAEERIKRSQELEQQERRKKIDAYFQPSLSPQTCRIISIVLLILGVVTLILYIGIAFLILSLVFFLLSKRRPKMTDEDFDFCVSEDMAYLDSLNILAQYGKDPSELVAPPCTMTAPDFEGAGLVEFLWRLGDDGKIRYSVIEITKAFMFEQQLMVFTATWDFTKGILMNETTHAYFYKDIVAINTQSVYDKTSNAWIIRLISMIPHVGEIIASCLKEKTTIYKTAETFELISSSGNSIGLTVGFDEWVLAHGGQVPDKTEAEAMIRSIRKMIEEKKNS